jgi:hypothetical protein
LQPSPKSGKSVDFKLLNSYGDPIISPIMAPSIIYSVDYNKQSSKSVAPGKHISGDSLIIVDTRCGFIYWKFVLNKYDKLSHSAESYDHIPSDIDLRAPHDTSSWSRTRIISSADESSNLSPTNLAFENFINETSSLSLV